MRDRTRPLLVRPGARYTCFGDGVCCTDVHAIGALSQSETKRLTTIREGCVERHAELRMHVVRAASGRCSFLGEGGCTLHLERGASFKPSVCRRFPYGLVATPLGDRVTTEHRCPCRTMGERPPIDAADARMSLRDARGRLSITRRVSRVAIEGAALLSFEDYEAKERVLLARLTRGELPEDVLGREGLPPLDGATWLDVGHHFRTYVDGTAGGEALAWFGDMVLALSGQAPRWLRRRPWERAFERAQARSRGGVGADEILADWLADALWDLEWTERGSLELAFADLSARLAVARRVVVALSSERTREDRAAAEALLIVELASACSLWPKVVATFAGVLVARSKGRPTSLSAVAYSLPRGLVGVLHLPALPGDPRHDGGSFRDVERFVMTDAEALVEGGVDAIILENFGSAPFAKGSEGHRVPAHQAATIAILATACTRLFAVPIGVNCLRNDAITALGVAAASGASFVRVNVHSGAYVTDQGLIEGEADVSMRYRASLGAKVAVLADVLVKHATPLAPLTPEDATGDVLHRGLADGVVVTGRATGAPVDLELLRRVRAAAGASPVFVGSGMTPEMVDAIAPLIEGAIVGTWLKQGGDVAKPVDAARVRELAAATRGKFRGPV